MTMWDETDADPLKDLENYSKVLREQKPITEADIKLVVPTWLVKKCIKADAIGIMWERVSTIIITDNAFKMLQKYCIEKNITMPGKCETYQSTIFE